MHLFLLKFPKIANQVSHNIITHSHKKEDKNYFCSTELQHVRLFKFVHVDFLLLCISLIES